MKAWFIYLLVFHPGRQSFRLRDTYLSLLIGHLLPIMNRFVLHSPHVWAQKAVTRYAVISGNHRLFAWKSPFNCCLNLITRRVVLMSLDVGITLLIVGIITVFVKANMSACLTVGPIKQRVFWSETILNGIKRTDHDVINHGGRRGSGQVTHSRLSPFFGRALKVSTY